MYCKQKANMYYTRADGNGNSNCFWLYDDFRGDRPTAGNHGSGDHHCAYYYDGAHYHYSNANL